MSRFTCSMCDSDWKEYDRFTVVKHYFEKHQGNLSFLSNKMIKEMIKEMIKNE